MRLLPELIVSVIFLSEDLWREFFEHCADGDGSYYGAYYKPKGVKRMKGRFHQCAKGETVTEEYKGMVYRKDVKRVAAYVRYCIYEAITPPINGLSRSNCLEVCMTSNEPPMAER